MTLFTASFDTVVMRFSLMMATVIVPFLMGTPILAILALPIFLAAITAISFSLPESQIRILAETEAIKHTKK